MFRPKFGPSTSRIKVRITAQCVNLMNRCNGTYYVTQTREVHSGPWCHIVFKWSNDSEGLVTKREFPVPAKNRILDVQLVAHSCNEAWLSLNSEFELSYEESVLMMGRSASNGLNACSLFPVSPFCLGTNYSNILIPSERMSGSHAGSTATARLVVVRKIIYLTKSEILYREGSSGGRGIPLLELYGGDPIPLQHPHTL